MTIADAMGAARKICVKIGSSTLARSSGDINTEFMSDFAAQTAALMAAGKQIVVVSSGAQVAGTQTIGRWARRRDIHYRQALCAIGQVELMDKWREAFRGQGLHIGQLLFTKDDFSSDHRTLNMRNTLFTLLDEGVVPVINENDSVSFDEIRIGDNDNLSALTAVLWNADLLILFSDIDGVFTGDPKTDPGASLVETVRDIPRLRETISIGCANGFGTGGIATKLEAAERVTRYGIAMALANGGVAGALQKLLAGEMRGTLFEGAA